MPTSRRDPVDFVIDDLEDFVGRRMVDLLFTLHTVLVEHTPLDLGWARANFVPQIGTPYRINLVDFEPTSGAANAELARSQSELFRIAGTYRVDLGNLFISNNVPYIGRLNDGHSNQAQPGYIQAAINIAIATERQR